ECGDFDLLYLLNLWHLAGPDLPAEGAVAIEQRILAFKYWFTEPTPDGIVDETWYRCENHRTIFPTVVLMPSKRWPKQRFRNQGRSYMKNKSTATDQDTFAAAKLLFDDTDLPYRTGADPGATLLSAAESWRLPAALLDIARHDEPMVDRERMGVPLDEHEPWSA